MWSEHQLELMVGCGWMTFGACQSLRHEDLTRQDIVYLMETSVLVYLAQVDPI